MSAIAPLPISDRITRPLAQVSQRQWTLLAGRGVLQTLVISLAVLLASALLLGFLPGIWMPVRVLLAVIAWGAVIWTAFRALRPALHRWNLSHAAQYAEGTLADSQERISSAVEIAQSDDEFRGSPELVAHLVRQAEEDAQRVNAAAIVPYSSIVHWSLLAVPVLALWVFCVLYSGTAQPVLRGLFNTLLPWETTLPPLLTDIQVLPGNVVLSQGDALDVSAKVSARIGGKEASLGQVALLRKFSTGPTISQPLEQSTGRQFHANLDNLQQSFQYQVKTNQARSPWYTATVRPVPAIARLDVHYDFPKYSALPPRDLTASDGNIDALAGTSVTLTLQSTDALLTDRSKLLFDSDTPDQREIPLSQIAKNTYQAKFEVTHSGDYRVKLLNEFNLPNKDDQPRAVTAEVDEPPVITITSPAEQVTVRPDDDVPVMYVADDDYGVARIEALVQVDDRPERTMPVVVHSKRTRDIHDQWVLSVPVILAQDGVKDARRISYQLKATDNRDPDPQTGLSARQTIYVNRNEGKSYADKLNEKRREDLREAIQKAINRLNESRGVVEPMAWRNPQQALDAEGRRLVTEERAKLATTGSELSTTAGDYLNTPFAEVAQAAKEIADNGIPQAADDTARISLDAENFALRKTDAEHARKEIVTARDALQKLLDRALQQALDRAEAAQALKEAAQKQEQVAQAMQKTPENTDQNRQQQQEAINKLNEAMQKDQRDLQNQKASQLAHKLAELADKIEQNEKQQTDLQNNTSKQQELAQAQDQANALLEQQKKLNEQVQQFAKNDKDPLQQASAPTPDQNQAKDLVKNIEKNQVQQAAQEAQQQADQLKQDAQKLSDAAKNSNIPPSGDQQKQQQQDAQAQQNAQTAQNDASKAADALKNQSNQADPKQNAADAANQAKKAAEQIQKQADALEQQNQKSAKSDDVQKEAQKAKDEAQQAQHDAQAAQDAANAQDAQKDLQKAGQELAQAGQDLNQAAQAEAKADQAMDQQQNQAAAKDAAQEAQGLADTQQQIADALKEQAQQAADAQQQGALPDQQAAQQQQQLAQQTRQAKAAAKQLAQQAQNQDDQNLADRADKAADALDQAAQAQKDAAQAEAKHDADQAGQAQADAQDALAKADQALRGDPEQGQADADQGNPDQGQPDQGQAQADSGQGHPEQGHGHPEQSAAQAAQEAAQAQQQALQPNPGAAAEAAQALARAASAAQQGLPGQEPGTDPADEPGMDQGQGQETASQPGQANDSKMGISGTASGGNNQVPASVEALGISPADWAKLPPLMQKELQNASRQSGPPSYRQMIKNYYVRVAHMQADQPQPARKQ